jgi:hypothetical protein
MNDVNNVIQARLVLAVLLVGGCAIAQQMPPIPTIDAPNQTNAQAETHFLTFLGSFIPESPASARAYYNAIYPGQPNLTFQQWLVNAGFIQTASEWNPSGPQTVITDPTQHGYARILADSHVIVLNAADLGFVRNQFIRCVPSCTALNPKIYTYLENYPVAPFSANFPGVFGSPTQAEAAAAMSSAITRPLGVLGGDGVSPCNGSPMCIERIADVAFEWTPAPNNPSGLTRYGKQLAFIFGHDSTGIQEKINWTPGAVAAQNNRIVNNLPFPPLCSNAPGSATCAIDTTLPFAPELDGRGAKQMPGVCLTCHGGTPKGLVSGVYPRQGNISGFRFLPLDIANLMFTSDAGPEPTSRASQEPNIKRYNQDVLLTVNQFPERDDQGVLRIPHLAEVVRGWYAPSMMGSTQNQNFVPSGWGGNSSTTLGQFYLNVVGPNCRSCHFNRELSLDFGTSASFDQESDLLQLALKVQCNATSPGYSVDPNLRPMPLAHLTFQRLWQDVNNVTGRNPTPMIQLLANHFGFASVNGYCATNP